MFPSVSFEFAEGWIPKMRLRPRIRKAVIPAAGLGRRFLPAIKAVPKEIFPVLDKPLIQYAVEEAVASGIESVILVTSTSKAAVEAHFQTNPDLEQLLEERGKQKEAALVRDVSRLARLFSVRQDRPLVGANLKEKFKVGRIHLFSTQGKPERWYRVGHFR